MQRPQARTRRRIRAERANTGPLEPLRISDR